MPLPDLHERLYGLDAVPNSRGPAVRHALGTEPDQWTAGPARGAGLPLAMAPATTPSTVSPLTARKTWRTVEPLHGMIYFAPEAAASYAALGLAPEAGYFASRSAAMGAVGCGDGDRHLLQLQSGAGAGAIPRAWEVAAPGGGAGGARRGG